MNEYCLFWVKKTHPSKRKRKRKRKH